MKKKTLTFVATALILAMTLSSCAGAAAGLGGFDVDSLGYGGVNKLSASSCENGHSFGNWTTYKEATVVSKAVERRTCANCAAYEEREVGGLVTFESANELHTFTNIYSDNYANYDNTYGEALRSGQGGCYNGEYFYQAFVNVNDTLGVVAKVNTTTGAVVYSTARDLGHANDMTYNSKTNEIIVIKASAKKAVIFDADTLAYKREQDLPVTATGISYNAHNDTYVLFNGGILFLYVVDSTFSTITSWSPSAIAKPTGYSSQGIFSDENYIYNLYYQDVDGVTNTLDYKAYVQVRDYNFNLINTFEIGLDQGFHEAESISIVDGKAYIGAAQLYLYSSGILRPYADFTIYEFDMQ